MKRSRHKGNTATEYSLIIGLILISSIVYLQYMGNSTSNLLGGLDGKDSERTTLSLLNPVENRGAGQVSSMQNVPGSLNNLSLTESGSSGANATSAEGSTAKVGENVRLLQELESVLKESRNPALQEWAKEHLARRIQWLTGSEGYTADLEAFQKLVPKDGYSKETALADISAYKEELIQIVQGTAPDTQAAPMPPGVPQETVQKIISIVNQVAANADNFIADNTGNKPDSVKGIAWQATYNTLADVNTLQNTVYAQANDTTAGKSPTDQLVTDTAQKAITLDEL
jgi:hypothetical protein